MTSCAVGGRFSCVADHHARMPIIYEYVFIIIGINIYTGNNDERNKKRITPVVGSNRSYRKMGRKKLMCIKCYPRHLC